MLLLITMPLTSTIVITIPSERRQIDAEQSSKRRRGQKEDENHLPPPGRTRRTRRKRGGIKSFPHRVVHQNRISSICLLRSRRRRLNNRPPR